MSRVAAALLVCLVHAAPAVACDMFNYRHVQPTPHVHVFEAAEGTTAVVNGNIVAVVGSEAILVVDTGQIPRVARKVVADLRRISPLPVRYIVNSHWHGDHLVANFVFREAFPGAAIVAHSHTIERAANFYTDYANKTGPRMPVIVADMKKRHDASSSEEEKLWLTRTMDCAQKMVPEIAQTRYVPPDTTLDGELKVDLGGVTAVVKHIGAGNTPGDLVVYVEADKLVVTGDMVVAPTPYAIGSSIEPWTKTLGELRKLGATTIVPGHGAVQRDDAYLRDLEALLVATRTQLVQMHAAGVSRKDAEGRLDIGAFRARLDTPMKRQAFEQFFVRPAIAQIWPKAPS